MKFFEMNGVSKKFFSGIFILKILFGVTLWAVYTFYYTDRATADIFKYFDDSEIIFNALHKNPVHFLKMLTGIGNNTPEFQQYYDQMHYWARKINSGIYNDSHTIIRFNAFARLFSFGYYTVHTVFICFLSLIGLTAIYKVFVPVLEDKKIELLAVVFFLPSILFWGSGVLKEGLILFSLGLLIYHFNKLFSLKSILICLAVGLLLALSKFYVWLSVLPGLLFLLWINKSGQSNRIIKFTVVMFIFAVVGLNVDKFSSVQNPLVTLSQKQIEFNELAHGNTTDAYNRPVPPAKSVIELDKLEPTPTSFLKNSPHALVNTIFRPFVWEMDSPMIILAGVENLFILVFIIVCVFYAKPAAHIAWTYVLFCLVFVVLQFLAIGAVTPILGAIVRYKVPALPFFMIVFLLILDKDKLRNRFPVLKILS